METKAKLVRDKIPQIIKAGGRTAKVRRIASDRQYLKHLLAKLQEETLEAADAAYDPVHLLEELADVQEVLDAIADLPQFGRAALRRRQAAKRRQRGGFKQRLLLLLK
ncbi:MAG TPA: nucleoside triphosphate pyrophosphohydrolase [Patescibacteria group bacterium]|nr:nucleoside triphosphate pyrophosphohydrolase [Patescibacteria group bacterium]